MIAKTEEQNGDYYIISKDSGFDFIVSFWNAHGVSVKRIPSFLYLKKPNNKPTNIIPIHTVKEESDEIIKEENTEAIVAAANKAA